jgi:hypothetical protein
LKFKASNIILIFHKLMELLRGIASAEERRNNEIIIEETKVQ